MDQTGQNRPRAWAACSGASGSWACEVKALWKEPTFQRVYSQTSVWLWIHIILLHFTTHCSVQVRSQSLKWNKECTYSFTVCTSFIFTETELITTPLKYTVHRTDNQTESLSPLYSTHFFSLPKLGAYITHNATWQSTVWSEILVGYANLCNVSSRR